MAPPGQCRWRFAGALRPQHGRVLFTRLAASGLWSADAALSPASVQQISDDRPSRWRYRAWTVAGSNAIGYLGTSTACGTTLIRIQAGHEQPEHCLDTQRLSAGNGLSASADGHDLFVAMAVSDGADIGVMRLPERAPALFPAFSSCCCSREMGLRNFFVAISSRIRNDLVRLS